MNSIKLSTATAAILLLGLASALASDCKTKHPGQSRGFQTPLEGAVLGKDTACVKEFLKNGADPDAWDRFGGRPVLIAAKGNPEIMELLLEYGVDPLYSQTDGSAIQIAACNGKLEVVKVLLKAGVDTTHQGKSISNIVCTCTEDSSCQKKAIEKLIVSNPGLSISFNLDYPSTNGILNDGKKAITDGNRACSKLCEAKSGCKVWTRIKRTIPGGSTEGECWLRSYQPTGKTCSHCDSGPMQTFGSGGI